MKATPQQIRSLRINRSQFKLMTAAGFHVDKFSYQLPEAVPATLIYWKRGDLTVVFFRYEAVSLKTYTHRLIHQVYYKTMRAAREQTIWPDTDKPCFKIEDSKP